MNTQPMPTRDLVLRLCDEPTELNQEWLATAEKVAVPVPVPSAHAGGVPRLELARVAVAAARAMGADELLVCRTRAEHMYEPVERVAARADDLDRVVATWGDRPDETLYALPDLSAAVLVTTGGIMLVAGAVPFVQAVVGPDITAAKEAFGEYALNRRDDLGLRRVAERYGCLEPPGDGARHARDAGVPRADTAERLSRAAARFRDRRPGATGAFRLLRTLVAWAAVALVIVVASAIPGTSNVIPVALGVGWLVIQLCVLCRSRTVTLAVLLRVVVLGALICLPTVLIERFVVARMGVPALDAVAIVRVGAPVEEVAKLVPVVLVWWFARRRFKRLAAVDYLLLAAASGAGFQLVESTVFVLTTGASVTSRLPTVPHFEFFALLPGWSDGIGTRFAGHAVLTGLVGACVGLAAVGGRRWGGRKLWLLPAVALGVVIFVHLAYDGVQSSLRLVSGSGPAFALLGHGYLIRPLFLLALFACVMLDHRVFRAVDDVVPPLPGTPPWAGLERFARGVGIRVRARVPREAAPVFHRAGGAVAGFVVTFAEATVRILHEWAVLFVALGRGVPALPSALRFLRDRRELAMGAYRAAGRPHRDMPPRAEVRRSAEALTAALGLAAALALVVGVAGAAAVRAPAAPAFLAAYVDPLIGWLGRFPPPRQALAESGGVALLVLLLTGWTTVDVRSPGRDAFLRDPRGSVTSVIRDLTPGRLPYLLLWVIGLAVPSSVNALLKPGVGAATPPLEPNGPTTPGPPPHAALVINAPPGPDPGLPDERWEFPQPALDRALKHAGDFGVPTGTSYDAPALRAALLAFVIEPGTLRIDITFAGRAARAVVDQARGRAVVFTPSGAFVTCLTLTEAQLAILLAEHQL
ncbi:MAG TPA: PrsW family glutamic-type intramembrane protease [Streptosporangiaceae bacterium]|jgi:RsiW-degrading membrane proteinase PrsW (M82 family)